MSDAAATPNKLLWTDTEKLGILFQIIEKQGSIPWDELTFPPGRTKKAVQVMIDKEKTKIRKAREANGDAPAVESTPSKSTKRKSKAAKSASAEDDDEAAADESPTKKKKPTSRKKKSPPVVQQGEDEEVEEGGGEKTGVKVEDAEEGGGGDL
ncbi:hypothetical protein EJ03DRAFT_355013 [Teratosphaeria nubilosa]|uniref:Myb-like domain-containing protein n=1 Tax=Teratosphaeria nubilosa TaxID=161662 RepID=A0A6G1KXD4_9PEZI|nr:hypothetical protein EJ03DRAFT_355013 [Teratosphaeria nubilosa]